MTLHCSLGQHAVWRSDQKGLNQFAQHIASRWISQFIEFGYDGISQCERAGSVADEVADYCVISERMNRLLTKDLFYKFSSRRNQLSLVICIGDVNYCMNLVTLFVIQSLLYKFLALATSWRIAEKLLRLLTRKLYKLRRFVDCSCWTCSSSSFPKYWTSYVPECSSQLPGYEMVSISSKAFSTSSL